MNLRLLALRLILPQRLRVAQLAELCRAAGTGLGQVAPELLGLPFPDAWLRFAAFTRDAADSALASGRDLAETRQRLYASALQLGCKLRQQLHLGNAADARTALRILYRAIGVDWSTAVDGTVTVRACRFASRYTPAVCALMSEMDRGMVEGITDGGHLVFLSRITEGDACCRAQVTFPVRQA